MWTSSVTRLGLGCSRGGGGLWTSSRDRLGLGWGGGTSLDRLGLGLGGSGRLGLAEAAGLSPSKGVGPGVLTACLRVLENTSKPSMSGSKPKGRSDSSLENPLILLPAVSQASVSRSPRYTGSDSRLMDSLRATSSRMVSRCRPRPFRRAWLGRCMSYTCRLGRPCMLSTTSPSTVNRKCTNPTNSPRSLEAPSTGHSRTRRNLAPGSVSSRILSSSSQPYPELSYKSSMCSLHNSKQYFASSLLKRVENSISRSNPLRSYRMKAFANPAVTFLSTPDDSKRAALRSSR
mmetsp:Transcript_4248/g.5841  ORF Transcript_4248/g.5841 Transcript_4248/m.5841 type:complete len:289 (+) Transcript_4248:287-1153(+)